MAYQMIEQYSSSFAGPQRVPKGFAIHWWGDPAQNPQFFGIVNVLIERAQQQSASVNFVAEAGRVACLISPQFVAWAQGDGAYGWGNNNLVSIECNPRCTAGDRETVAELIADQHILNGIPIVLYPHKNFNSTQCPGVWEQWIPSITARAKQIVAQKQGKVNPTPAKPAPAKPAPAKGPITRSNSEIHWVVSKGDTLSKISRYYGPTVAQIAAHNGISVNAPLKVGQKIWIPGPLVWKIEAPDTVASICKYYGISWEWLAKRNPTQVTGPNSTLYIGNVLKIL